MSSFTKEQIEAAAEEVYNCLPGSKAYPWVAGGNSHKQNEARMYADAALGAFLAQEGQAVTEALVARMQAITTAGFELGAALTNVPEAIGSNPEDFIRRDAVMALVVEWREKMGAAPKVDLRAALARPAAPAPEALRPIQTNRDTDGMEAGRIIGRLMSSDPDFDDCADAANLIHKLIIEKQGADGQAVDVRDVPQTSSPPG